MSTVVTMSDLPRSSPAVSVVVPAAGPRRPQRLSRLAGVALGPLLLLACGYLILPRRLDDSANIRPWSTGTRNTTVVVVTTQVPPISPPTNDPVDLLRTTAAVERPSRHHNPNDEIDEQAARNFVVARRSAYQKLGLEYRWKLRGIGYLYTRHNLTLLAQLPTNPVVVGTPQRVIIRNVFRYENGLGTVTRDCDKLNLWVRVNGPEIFAGAASSVRDGENCHWTFDFDLQTAGAYEVDVKLLIWNGAAPVGGTPNSQCQYAEGLPSNETMKDYKHDGFQGFKMYSPVQMCCEVCARTLHCVSWATPFLRIENPTKMINGCELFFDNTAPNDDIPQSSLWPLPPQNERRRRRLATHDKYHGLVHKNPTSYFCGCGWSFWFTLDFPCLSGDLDDRVFSVVSKFNATLPATTTTTAHDELVPPIQPLPFCTMANEQLGTPPSRGRWVRQPWPDETTCPAGFHTTTPRDKDFPLTQFDGLHPQCWHREDFTKIGMSCVEMNCRFIDTTLYWRSSIRNETKFAGIWRPYSCHYMQFTTPQLQECVTKRKIVRFQKMGQSVAQYVNEFVQYRLQNVTLYPNISDPEALSVVFDTLSLLHKNGPDGMLEDAMEKLSVAPKNQEHYWITGFFLSSEREVHAHVSRMHRYNHILSSILETKNYRMINAFDLTAAFTYEAATQNDGMHFIGPPMKMIVTKLFHHLCHDVVNGTPL